MSAYRIVGGNVGTQIVFTVREWPIGTPPRYSELAPIVNMAAASNIKLILIPPPGVLSQSEAEHIVSASLYTDGTDGNIAYTTIAGDVPDIPFRGQPQLWVLRASFTLSGWSGKSEPDTMFVDP